MIPIAQSAPIHADTCAKRTETGTNREKLVVGVFGYYHYRNFGDNVMAYMLARHLELIGCTPLIYSDDQLFTEQYGMRIEPSLQAFVGSADVVILGGGGLFTPQHKLKGSERITKDMNDIVVLCKSLGVPIYGISLGGSGISLEEIEPVERRNLVAATKYCTVRNREDLKVLEGLGRPGEYLPDIVWTLPNVFPQQRKSEGRRKTIGFNFVARGGRKRKVLEPLLKLLVRLRSEWDFIFLDVNPNDVVNGGSVGHEKWGTNCKKVVLRELGSAMELLSSLDLLVTMKLHAGVAAMSCGIPVVSYAGEPKTKLLFRSIGLENMCWGPRQLYKLLLYLALPGGIRRLEKRFAVVNVERIIGNAANHFSRLTELIEEVRNGRQSAHEAKDQCPHGRKGVA